MAISAFRLLATNSKLTPVIASCVLGLVVEVGVVLLAGAIPVPLQRSDQLGIFALLVERLCN